MCKEPKKILNQNMARWIREDLRHLKKFGYSEKLSACFSENRYGWNFTYYEANLDIYIFVDMKTKDEKHYDVFKGVIGFCHLIHEINMLDNIYVIKKDKSFIGDWRR